VIPPTMAIPPSEEGYAPLSAGPQAGVRLCGRVAMAWAATCNGVSGCCTGWAVVCERVRGGVAPVADWFLAKMPEAKPREELEWKVPSLTEAVVEELLKLGRHSGLVAGLTRLDPQGQQVEYTYASNIANAPYSGISELSVSTISSGQGQDFHTKGDVGIQTSQCEEEDRDEEEGEDAEMQEIQVQCRANGLRVTAALAYKVMANVLRKQRREQCDEQRFRMGDKYQKCTTEPNGRLVPLDLPEDLQGSRSVRGVNVLDHAWPWKRPPRSLCYVEVAQRTVDGGQQYWADPDTVTLAEPQDPKTFPGSNLLIAVTDSEWSWQMFMSVWNVIQFTVSNTLALQQALTLPTAGFGFWKCALYCIVVVVKIAGPLIWATQNHAPDPDLPEGYHRIGHRLRDLFCQAIGIRWLVRNAHRALDPEYLDSKGLNSLARNVGSRLGCRVPLVYAGPCANQLWREVEHMKHRLVPTFGADGILLIMSVLLVRASFCEHESAASKVIGIGNALFMAVSFVGLGVQLVQLWRGLSDAQLYAVAQMATSMLRPGSLQAAQRTQQKTVAEMQQVCLLLTVVVLVWGILIVALAVSG